MRGLIAKVFGIVPIIFLVAGAASAQSNAAFVRAAGASGESTRYTASITPAAGDFLAVFVWQVEGATTPSVTDNLGTTYTRDCDLTFNQGFGVRRLTVFHLLEAPSGITGINVTPNRPSRAIVAEYSGMPSSGTVLDVCGTVNTQTTSATSWSSTATTTTTTDLVFGLADTGFTGNATYKASGVWNGRATQHDTIDADDSYVEDQLNMPAGSYTATGTTTASVGDSSVVVAFKSTVAPVASVTLNPANVVGGNPSTGTVTLGTAAPSGGAIVTLASNNLAVATVPPSITVAVGTTTATFTVLTTAVTTTATASITATYNSSTQGATLTVNPLPVAGAASFVRAAGGTGESVRYTASIAPAIGDFLAVLVWQTEGAATPSVTDNLATAYTKDCDLTFNQGFGVRRLTVFHLLNAPSGITGVNITPNKPSRTIVAEYSGMPASGTILDVCGTVNNQNTLITSWMSTAAITTANDLVLGLADTGMSGNAGYAASGLWNGRMAQHDSVDVDDSYLEDQLNVAAGSYTATGTSTSSVHEASVVVAFKTSTGPVPLASVAINPPVVLGGNSSTGTVTLASAAPAGGALVALSSSDPSTSVSPSVMIAAGQTKATFPITTIPVTSSTLVTISGTYNGKQSTSMTVMPLSALAVTSVTLNPAAVIGGNPSTATVTLNVGAPAGGVSVTLGSDNSSVATVPVSVTVPGGVASDTFTVTTLAVVTVTPVTISGTYNTTQGATLTVNPAQTLPTLAQVQATIEKVNNYWIIKNPTPDNTDWTGGTYYTGDLAAYDATGQANYLTYAQTWATKNGYNLMGGNTTTDADYQAAGQAYIRLYQLNPNPTDIAGITQSASGMVNSTEDDEWWWIDAINMSMPDFAYLGSMNNDTTYYTKMYALYSYPRYSLGLYDPSTNLWWRDSTFTNTTTYWSRGNGWVLAALAKVLSVLPTSDPHYAEYRSTFIAMAQAIAARQQPGGYWNSDLGGTDFAGPESSGTSFFLYGLAWGIKNGVLDPNTYLPVVEKAWNFLANTAVQPSGLLGYVQPSGDAPGPTSATTTEDFGVGAFLLAARQVGLMTH